MKRTENVIEICPNCACEVSMLWDTEKDGYKAFCPHCGKRLMLCDACRHNRVDKLGNGVGVCDYNADTDTCRNNRLIPNFSTLSDLELREFGANVFGGVTGEKCMPLSVTPQECSQNRYWFRVGNIYIVFRRVGDNNGLWETVLTDPDGNDLMTCQ